MSTQQIILLVINAIGGLAVIGSYIFGLNNQAGGSDVLWGGVSTSIRPVYFVSMILSALGYFAFIYFIVFKLDPNEVSIASRFGYSLFYFVFIGILAPSALWMPMTNVYVNNNSTGTWILVRTILFIVGLSSIALLWALLTLQTKLPAVPYWLAVSGAAYFTFHTFILDGLLWAALFRK